MKNKYESVPVRPVKSFFVYTLVRDISLEDAVLDLLDNCLDGILRTQGSNKGDNPYSGFRAEIKFDENSFTISDNCGGIPWNLHDYAFRIGRADDRKKDPKGTVGVYGIGMKRAIFKIGKNCLISTRNGKDNYEVKISPEWIEEKENWEFPVYESPVKRKEEGTTISISELYDGIKEHFGSLAFESNLKGIIATHYAFIIDKGLAVCVNGALIKPRPTKLVFNKNRNTIQPFVFKTKTPEGVEIFLTVGFTRPIPSSNELLDEQESKKWSTVEAGWTVLCNDRAVLYCDRSIITGWGEANVPRYHTQFIAISGIVEFKGDASKLPTTTTKRNIEASSPLYIQIKNKMREGMKIFIDYTNKWKGREHEAKKHIEAGMPLSFEEIKLETTRVLRLTTLSDRSLVPGKQYKPMLPMPKELEKRMRRINFVKDVEDVTAVADYLKMGNDADPSEVGEKCFDLIRREARR